MRRPWSAMGYMWCDAGDVLVSGVNMEGPVGLRRPHLKASRLAVWTAAKSDDMTIGLATSLPFSLPGTCGNINAQTQGTMLANGWLPRMLVKTHARPEGFSDSEIERFRNAHANRTNTNTNTPASARWNLQHFFLFSFLFWARIFVEYHRIFHHREEWYNLFSFSGDAVNPETLSKSTISAQDYKSYGGSTPTNTTSMQRGSHADSFDHDRGLLGQATQASAFRDPKFEAKAMPLSRLSQESSGRQQEFGMPGKNTAHATSRPQTEPFVCQRSPNVSSQQPKVQSGPLSYGHQPSHEGSHFASATPHYDQSSQPTPSSWRESGNLRPCTPRHDPALVDVQYQLGQVGGKHRFFALFSSNQLSSRNVIEPLPVVRHAVLHMYSF